MVEWLNRYEQTKQEMGALEFEKISSELEYYRWKDGDLSRTQSFDVVLAKQAELLRDIEEKEKTISLMKKQLKYIEATVEKFDGILNMIARERYIEGKTLVQIAEENHYSYQYICNKHAEIKNILNFSQEAM